MLGHLKGNAVAYLALFVALGGTSYAAIKLPANSVGAKQIKKNAITSAKVKNHTLRSSDFAPGVQLAGPAGPAGATGPKGDAGPPGPTLGFDGRTTGCCDAPSFNFTTHSITQKTVHLPFAARLYVHGAARVGVTCNSSGPCEEDYDITVDGTGLPTSQRRVTAGTSQASPFAYIDPTGISGVLPAGDHEIRIARQGTNPNVSSSSFQDTAINVIALGG